MPSENEVDGEPFYIELTEFPGGPNGPLIDTVPAAESNRCTWEPNHAGGGLGGGWEINGEGWWRLGPFRKVEL